MKWTLEGTTEAIGVRYSVGSDEIALPSDPAVRAAYIDHTLARAGQVAKNLLSLYGAQYPCQVLAEDFPARAASVYGVPEWDGFEALVYIDKSPAQGFYLVKSA